jgi:hypothetical protein
VREREPNLRLSPAWERGLGVRGRVTGSLVYIKACPRERTYIFLLYAFSAIFAVNYSRAKIRQAH